VRAAGVVDIPKRGRSRTQIPHDSSWISDERSVSSGSSRSCVKKQKKPTISDHVISFGVRHGSGADERATTRTVAKGQRVNCTISRMPRQPEIDSSQPTRKLGVA